MSVRETADRLKKDVQYLRDLSYIANGEDVVIRGPSLTALLESLTKTLIEVQAIASSGSDEAFNAAMAAIRDRSNKAQAELMAQAGRAATADATLNKMPSAEQPADPTNAETPQ